MGLFRIKGRAPDETYLFDENPDPERYEAVSDDAKPAKPVKDTPPETEESA